MEMIEERCNGRTAFLTDPAFFFIHNFRVATGRRVGIRTIDDNDNQCQRNDTLTAAVPKAAAIFSRAGPYIVFADREGFSIRLRLLSFHRHNGVDLSCIS